MSNFFRALKRGVSAAVAGASGPWEFEAAGKKVRCSHCGTTAFGEGSALLETRVTALSGVAWTAPSATVLVCSECGHLEWFLKAPERR